MMPSVNYTAQQKRMRLQFRFESYWQEKMHRRKFISYHSISRYSTLTLKPSTGMKMKTGLKVIHGMWLKHRLR